MNNSEETKLSFRKTLGMKELDIVDLFILSFGVFRENILNFIILGLFLGLPTTILSIFVKMPVLDAALLNSTNDLIVWWKKEITTGFLLVNFLNFALDVLLIISIANMVESMVYRKVQSASWGLVSGLKLFFPVLTTQILYAFIFFLSFSLFIIPGVITGVFMMFAVYSSSLRHSYGIRAFRYSIEMVRTRFFKSLFILLFIIVFSNTILITIFQGNLTSREGLLSYFMANIIYNIFNSYFKVILSMYFLNIYYCMNDTSMYA